MLSQTCSGELFKMKATWGGYDSDFLATDILGELFKIIR